MKKWIIILVLCIPFIQGKSQILELGGFIGGSNYFGDLAPIALNPAETYLAGGAFIRFFPVKFISFRLGVSVGKIAGDDSKSVDAPDRIIRNLSFSSSIEEIYIIGEWNLFGFDNQGTKISPYVFGGIAYYSFNPTATLNGQEHELQPLSTEGQGTSAFPERSPYKLNQFSVPLGAGIKYSVSTVINLGLEVGFRKTFTDYLDDVSMTYADANVLLSERGQLSVDLSNRSGEVLGTPMDWGNADQRGDAEDLDWYVFAGLTVAVSLKNRQVGFKRKNSRIKGFKHSCPDNF